MDRRDDIIALLCLSITVICATVFCFQMFTTLLESDSVLQALEYGLFGLIILGFIYGSLVFHVTRIGFLRRSRQTPAVDVPDDRLPLITLLLPSFKEEARSIGEALLSCGLLDYPRKRVVLLIDDAPDPLLASDVELLHTARALPVELGQGFADLKRALCPFQDALASSKANVALSGAYRTAATRVYQLSSTLNPPADHTSRCFFESVILPVTEAFSRRAAVLDSSSSLSRSEAAQELATLASRFDVDFSSFERKQYANLSHEPNKAMNINSYLSLMGRTLWEEDGKDGRLLLDATKHPGGTIRIPESSFVITLDADSFLTQSYARTLIGFLESPGNEGIAVAQTPYSAIPGSPIVLERAAGATTDMQYITHQGFTAHGATYWVGANAVLRKAALDEIAELDNERGFPIWRFIQDRTVIEDTESSIDLIAKGWTLFNYPERLSYSATPADGGSLLIQRRRWSNGGLLIFPKMVRYYLGEFRSGRVRMIEALLRAHYLVSPTLANFGLLALFLIPFEKSQLHPIVVLASLPYFYCYTSDLARNGYNRTHVFNVYALNLLLIPINIGGILKSVQQGLTSKKVPFSRTPKVGSRTRMPAFYVMLEGALVLALTYSAASDLVRGRLIHLAFSMFNLALLSYALAVFLGISEMWTDLTASIRRPAKVEAPALVERRDGSAEENPYGTWQQVHEPDHQTASPASGLRASRKGR